jgi:amino acid transporter
MANFLAQPPQQKNSGKTLSPFLPLLSEYYVPKTMPNILGHRDMFFMYVLALFLMTNAVISASGGAVSLLYLIIGSFIFFLPCIVVAAQLGVLFPHEGSLYNWTYHALGGFWSFFVSLLYWITGVFAIITAADAFVTTLQGLHSTWLPEPWQQGLVILGVLAVATVICLGRMRTTQNIINIIIVLTICSTMLVAVSAVTWLYQGHPAQTDFSLQASNWAINPSNYFFFAITTLSFIGTSGPLNMAGEFKGAKDNEQLHKSIVRRHLIWGSLCVFILYAVTALSVLIVRGQAMAKAAVLPFECFNAVYVALGQWAGDLAVLGFLCYCVGAAIFYTMASSRIVMVAAIDQRIPTWFGRLNRVRVPQNAILFQSVFTTFVTLIVFVIAPSVSPIGGGAANALVIIYNVISASTTLVWTFATAFFFINIVLIYLRYKQRFQKSRVLPLAVIWVCVGIGGIACLLTIVGILAFSWIPDLISNGQWWLPVSGLVAGVVAITSIGSLFANSAATWEIDVQEFAPASYPSVR